jgi:hypothetical protein
MANRADPTPREIRQWSHDLVAFRDAYVTYLNETIPRNGTPIPQARRREVVRLAQPAQVALDGLGADFVWLPPPVTQTGPMRGLVNTVFVHETPFGDGVGSMCNWPKSWEGILNVVDSSLAQLETMDREARRRRHSPFYRGDRILRALLGFPAYLLVLIFGVPATRIEDSVWGTALRVSAFVVESALLVLGLNALFNWF